MTYKLSKPLPPLYLMLSYLLCSPIVGMILSQKARRHDSIITDHEDREQMFYYVLAFGVYALTLLVVNRFLKAESGRVLLLALLTCLLGTSFLCVFNDVHILLKFYPTRGLSIFVSLQNIVFLNLLVFWLVAGITLSALAAKLLFNLLLNPSRRSVRHLP